MLNSLQLNSFYKQEVKDKTFSYTTTYTATGKSNISIQEGHFAC